MVVRIVQHRFAREHLNWAFTKHDVFNVFISIDDDALDLAVVSRALQPDDQAIIRDRYRRSLLVLEAPDSHSALYKEFSGCKP